MQVDDVNTNDGTDTLDGIDLNADVIELAIKDLVIIINKLICPLQSKIDELIKQLEKADAQAKKEDTSIQQLQDNYEEQNNIIGSMESENSTLKKSNTQTTGILRIMQKKRLKSERCSHGGTDW